MKKLTFILILILSLTLTPFSLFSCTVNDKQDDGAQNSGEQNNTEQDNGERDNGGQNEAAKKSRKVLLVSIDGMRPDALLESKHADRLIKSSTYYTAASTVYPSVTLPCHMSMHHGVSPASHGVYDNNYTPADNLTDGIAETCAKAGKSCAFFYNWGPLGDVISDGALTKREYVSGETLGWHEANSATALACGEYLAANETDFTFLYLGCLDEMGHAHGWLSEEYRAALDSSLELVFGIIDTLPEEYTVIITTDHGGHGFGHGSELPEDMTVPIFIMGDGFSGQTRLEGGSILDIAPTVADILGVEPSEFWEGKSLK